MDMWNWLMDCYEEGSLSVEDLEAVMLADSSARNLWREFAHDSDSFIEFVREDVKPFVRYIKNKERMNKNLE